MLQATHRRIAKINVDDTPVCRAVALSIEGGVAHEQLVHQHSQGPDVHSFVVLLD